MSYMKCLDEYSDTELERELQARHDARADGKCDYCGQALGSRWRQLNGDAHVPGEPRPVLTDENSHLSCCRFPERHDMSPPEPEPAPALTIDHFIEVNKERRAQWHTDDHEPWNGADWAGAMMGEAGEVAEEVLALVGLAFLTQAGGHAADTVKKLRRDETGLKGNRGVEFDELKKKLGFELADTFAYLCLLADHYEIDISQAIIDKFNEVSVKHDFPQRL